MKSGDKLWTREELILGINLYSKLPFGKLHKGNSQIKELATLIGRTPSSVSLKLVNFASLDPKLKARGIKGMSKAGGLTEKIWSEFYGDWDDKIWESEQLLAAKKDTTVAQLNNVDISDLPREGKERERLVKVRVNQKLFRTFVLSNYNDKCCITGIANPELLVASHIAPWSKDKQNRLNPMNGLCLNALHDRAFDCGLLTILADDYTICLSPKLKTKNPPEYIRKNFLDLENMQIQLPKKFLPSRELLKEHNNLLKK